MSDSLSKNRTQPFWIILAGLLVASIPGAPVVGADGARDAAAVTAQQLSKAAHQAAVDGDTARCFELWRQVVRVAPDNRLARWQLGQIEIDGDWMAVEEAQRRAAADPTQADYRELRQAHGETPQGQMSLARWCRKNDLDDEARFHWASVLSIDPGNDEALDALDMRWQNGQLLTREQIARQRDQLREWKQSEKHWKPRIAKWRRAVAGNDSAKRGAALDEIRGLTAVDAIEPLERVTLGRDAYQKEPAAECELIGIALMDALAGIPDQLAADSLVRHALFSPSAETRAAAVEKLKDRALHDYVPLLLSGLAMPIESSFHVKTDPDGSVHYWHSLYREGPEMDWELDTRRSAVQNDLGGRHYTYDVESRTVEVGPPNGAKPREQLKKARVASSYLNRFGNSAAITELRVRRTNQVTETNNAVIMRVLSGTTGKKHSTPTDWWTWWRDHNEYYASEEQPVYRQHDSDTDHFYYGAPSYDVRYPPPPPLPPGKYSCFAKGTLVWTKTGQRPIETLELGDQVLSQNVDTGELTYKPVIGRTLRPPSEILKLSIGSDQIRTTRGHPLWVSGIGWRMAKELEDGAVLHGVTGPVSVTSVESSGEDEAFNLVVADFNTYFVGDSGVLVHDNTPRRTTRATVPGVVAH
jgi:hypothetical protein